MAATHADGPDIAQRLADAITVYEDLGVDAEGDSHHYDADSHTVVVAEGDARGGDPLEQTEHVERLGGRTVAAWMRYVDEKRGWDVIHGGRESALEDC
jgi:hypothetical protein